jgi:hypothetical protein
MWVFNKKFSLSHVVFRSLGASVLTSVIDSEAVQESSSLLSMDRLRQKCFSQSKSFKHLRPHIFASSIQGWENHPAHRRENLSKNVASN